MDEVIESILEARTKAIENWLAKNEIVIDDKFTDKYVMDIVTLPNGDEKVTLFEKTAVDSTVLTYKVAYGKE